MAKIISSYLIIFAFYIVSLYRISNYFNTSFYSAILLVQFFVVLIVGKKFYENLLTATFIIGKMILRKLL